MTQRNNGLKKVCGGPRHRWPKCRHPWHFAFQWKGQRHRVSLDRVVGHPLRTKRDAEEAADTVRTAIRAGAFPPAPEPPAPQTADAGRIHLHESMERAEARKSGKQMANSHAAVAGQRVDDEASRQGKSLLH